MQINRPMIRHLAGGFVGGMLGILLGKYAHPAWLWTPIGCSIGVVVGFWHDIVLKTIKDHPFKKLERMLPHAITWSQWASYATMIPLIALNVAQFYAFTQLSYYIVGEYETIGTTMNVMWFIGTAVGAAFAAVCLVENVRSIQDRGLSAFYKEWEQWDQGAARFIAGKFLDLLRGQIVLMLSLFLLFCGIVGSLAVTICAVLPVAIFFGLIKGTVIGIRRGGYGLCLATTLTVTCLMAYRMHSQFDDQSVLWLTALATGAVSAAASEGLRQACLWLLTMSPAARRLRRINVSKKVAPIYKKLFAIFETIWDVTSKSRPVQTLTPSFMR